MDLSRFRSIRAANVQQAPFFGISKFRQQSAFFTQNGSKAGLPPLGVSLCV